MTAERRERTGSAVMPRGAGRPAVVRALRPIHAGAAKSIMSEVAGMHAQCHSSAPWNVSNPPQRAVERGQESEPAVEGEPDGKGRDADEHHVDGFRADAAT